MSNYLMYAKVCDVIRSCESVEQLVTAYRYIELYGIRMRDDEKYNKAIDKWYDKRTEFPIGRSYEAEEHIR